eukprot:5697624-Amphidinium_carterae.1
MKTVFLTCTKSCEYLDSTQYVRMCRDYELFDKSFEVKDADIDFKKVTGPNGVDFKRFKRLLKLMARRKCVPVSSIVAWVVTT